jgi:phosphate uptake regulator
LRHKRKGTSLIEESRKVQLTGGSTYIVSLPKDWVRQVGIERGDSVDIVQRGDLTICIQPKGARYEEAPKKAVLSVSDDVSADSVLRRVVSAYLSGHNIIQIANPESRIDATQRRAIKDYTRRKLVGTEILSDLPRELTLQVLLSYTELSVKDALRRMSIIAASMHRDALNTLTTDDPQLAKEIVSMDDEVDRFSLYIMRLLNVAVADRQILQETGLRSPTECLGYRLVTKFVERMADHAVNIAQNSLTLNLSKPKEEIISELTRMSESAFEVFEDAVEALFAEDYKMADRVLDKAEETRAMEAGAVQKIIKNSDPQDVPALRLIIESILRTAEYGSDIAESVLNMTVRDEIKEA